VTTTPIASPLALVDLVRERLVAALAPESIEVFDDSAAHAGHRGVIESGGGGHFEVFVVSQAFEGRATVARHRMLYAALADLIPARIHALSIRALTPGEAAPAPD
jgi:BolA protein